MAMKIYSACGSTLYLSDRPLRVVNVIGAFTFGSLPQVFYHRLAGALCTDYNYSVVLHPFPFTPFAPDHWKLALSLYERLRTLQLRDFPVLTGRDHVYLQPSKNVWLGHSLGCKLIELLELLTLAPSQRREALREILTEAEAARIEALLDGTGDRLHKLAVGLQDSQQQVADDVFRQEWDQQRLQHLQQADTLQPILDQPSILMAPQISGATRVAGTNLRLYDSRVQPSWEQTCYLVRSQTSIFNLTDVIAFDDDSIAADDVVFLRQALKARQQAQGRSGIANVSGGHFRPLCPTPALLTVIARTIESRNPVVMN